MHPCQQHLHNAFDFLSKSRHINECRACCTERDQKDSPGHHELLQLQLYFLKAALVHQHRLQRMREAAQNRVRMLGWEGASRCSAICRSEDTTKTQVRGTHAQQAGSRNKTKRINSSFPTKAVSILKKRSPPEELQEFSIKTLMF